MKYGVGIDVSKGKSTVAILSIEGEVIEEVQCQVVLVRPKTNEM